MYIPTDQFGKVTGYVSAKSNGERIPVVKFCLVMKYGLYLRLRDLLARLN